LFIGDLDARGMGWYIGIRKESLVNGNKGGAFASGEEVWARKIKSYAQ
jgi:hypothetical protein